MLNQLILQNFLHVMTILMKVGFENKNVWDDNHITFSILSITLKTYDNILSKFENLDRNLFYSQGFMNDLPHKEYVLFYASCTLLVHLHMSCSISN